MERKLKTMENEKHQLDDLKITKTMKNLKNDKCTQQDLEYGEKTENQGKCKIHTLVREIRGGILKKVENLEMSTKGHGIWQEN